MNRQEFFGPEPTPTQHFGAGDLSACQPSRLARQVISLAFLAYDRASRTLSECLAQSLCSETSSSVILVRFTSPHQQNPRDYLNGEFHLPSVLDRTEAGFHLITVGVRPDDPPSPVGLMSLMETLSRHFRHVLIEAPTGPESPAWISELLLRSDVSYLFFDGKDTSGLRSAARLVQAVRSQQPRRSSHLKLIACVGAGETVNELESEARLLNSPIHFFIRGGSPDGLDSVLSAPQTKSNWFRADVRRLAREIGGRLVGMALSSGAAKGFAHIGVIQVLEENGIEVDVVAGSSMGAYVGSLWAQGNPGPELERLSRELEGRWPVWSLIDPVFPPRQGFVRGYAIKRRLMRTLGEARFGDLPMPLRVVATNLETLERVVFSGGEVAAAVHASIAVPGICVPITIDGETYIDGGIVDPLPVGVLREMGVTRTIAVDVIPSPERIREALMTEEEVARRGRRRGIFRRKNPINQQFNYFARGNLFEILMRSIQGAQIRVAQASGLLADVLLQPEIRDDKWLDYRNPGKFIQLGREAAEKKLEEIKALVNRAEAPPPGIPVPIHEARQTSNPSAVSGSEPAFIANELEKGAGI